MDLSFIKKDLKTDLMLIKKEKVMGLSFIKKEEKTNLMLIKKNLVTEVS